MRGYNYLPASRANGLLSGMAVQDAVDEALQRARALIARRGEARLREGEAAAAPAMTVAVLEEADEPAAVALLASAFSADEGAPASPAEPEAAFDWALGPRMRASPRYGSPDAPVGEECSSRPARRAVWFSWYLRWVVLIGLRYGLLLGLFLPELGAGERGELAGVAVALPPGRHWVSDTSSWGSRVRPHFYAVGLKMGRPPPDEWRPADYSPGTSARMRAIGSAAVRARAQAASEQGWHVYAMATAMAHQRMGCARELLGALAELADADCADLFAEAASPRLRSMLEQLGFVQAGDATPAVSGPQLLPDGEQPPRIALMRRPAGAARAPPRPLLGRRTC